MTGYWKGYVMAGLVLGQSEFDNMLENYIKFNPSQGDILETIEDYGLEDMLFTKSACAGEPMPGLHGDKASQYAGETMHAVRLSKADTSGVTLWPFVKPDGSPNMGTGRISSSPMQDSGGHPAWDADDTACYVFESDRPVTGAAVFGEKPYGSYGGFVREFKDKLERYLPEDFDWDAHIGCVQYAAYA